MSELKQRGPKASAPREQRLCEKEGIETEWRCYKLRTKADGTVMYQWRCHSCLNRSDNSAKLKRRRSELVALGATSYRDHLSAHMLNKYGKHVDAAWKLWSDLTERNDGDRPNIDFANVLIAALKAGRTPERLLYLVRLAALDNRGGDSFDVNRLTSMIETEKFRLSCIRRSAEGQAFITAPSDLHFRYKGQAKITPDFNVG